MRLTFPICIPSLALLLPLFPKAHAIAQDSQKNVAVSADGESSNESSTETLGVTQVPTQEEVFESGRKEGRSADRLLIRWGCLRFGKNKKDGPLPPYERFLSNEKLFVNVAIPEERDALLDSYLKPENIIPPSEARKLSVKGFPLIGEYFVSAVTDEGELVLQPSCLVDLDFHLADDWREMELAKLPPGLKSLVEAGTRPRVTNVPINTPVPVPNNVAGDTIVGVPQEIFFSFTKNEERFAVVKIARGSWFNGIKAMMSEKVIELNDIARLGIILLLTLPYIWDFGRRNRRRNEDE